MSRQTPERQGHEKLGTNRFGVVTQGIYVATRTRLLKKIYVATSKKYVATQIKNKPIEKVATKKTRSYDRGSDKDWKFCHDRTSVSPQRDQFGPKFWGSTM